MKKVLLFVSIIIAGATYLPSYASDLDQECVDFCKGNGSSDGHYLAQEPGAKCKDGYTQNDENQICCCK